jgi:hypothetical protein
MNCPYSVPCMTDVKGRTPAHDVAREASCPRTLGGYTSCHVEGSLCVRLCPVLPVKRDVPG